MAFEVFLADAAKQDLGVLYDFLDRNAGRGTADHVLDQIEEAFSSFSDSPNRRAFPWELLALGIREYRELYVLPYASFTGSWPTASMSV